NGSAGTHNRMILEFTSGSTFTGTVTATADTNSPPGFITDEEFIVNPVSGDTVSYDISPANISASGDAIWDFFNKSTTVTTTTMTEEQWNLFQTFQSTGFGGSGSGLNFSASGANVTFADSGTTVNLHTVGGATTGTFTFNGQNNGGGSDFAILGSGTQKV